MKKNEAVGLKTEGGTSQSTRKQGTTVVEPIGLTQPQSTRPPSKKKHQLKKPTRFKVCSFIIKDLKEGNDPMWSPESEEERVQKGCWNEHCPGNMPDGTRDKNGHVQALCKPCKEMGREIWGSTAE